MTSMRLSKIHEFISRIEDHHYPHPKGSATAALEPASFELLREKLETLYDADDEAGEDQIRIGSQITVVDEIHQTRLVVVITLPEDSDVSQGRISILSPLAAALIGHRTGETVEVILGARKTSFRITAVNTPLDS